MNFLSNSILALSFIAISSMCHAMQLTDVEGKVLNLTPAQLDAFKQCAIYTDYQDNIAKDETAKNDITNQSKIWSFADCTNSELKADYICKLMDLINNKIDIASIQETESGNVFALSLYMGVPEHKIQKLAEKFYDYFQNNKAQLQSHPNFKNYMYLEKAAIKYLPYYPDMNAFIEDFEICYVKNGHPVGWEDLLEKSPNGLYHLNLSFNKLQKIGFIKKIYSLQGIEKFSCYLNCQFIEAIFCAEHKINDFNINILRSTFPELTTLSLYNNNIKRLHKKQFENCPDHFTLSLNNNGIEYIEPDCFALAINARLQLQINMVNAEQFQNICFPVLKLKNTAIRNVGKITFFASEIIFSNLIYKWLVHNTEFKNIPFWKMIMIPSNCFKLGTLALLPSLAATLCSHILLKKENADIWCNMVHTIIYCANGRVYYDYSSDKPRISYS